MKLLVPKGATALLVDIFVPDVQSGGGAGLTGLANDTAGLAAYYHRNTEANDVEIELAAMSLGTWASGGFVEVDSTNMPGVYQLGLPNALLADGADSAVVMLHGAAGMAPVLLEVQLTDQVYQARIWMTDDNQAGIDRYLTRVWVDDEVVMSGLSNPTIQVVKPDDTDLIAETPMSPGVGADGRLRHNATGAERILDGQLYEVIVRVTVNGAERMFAQQISRDS